jgi:hypothetical protein
LSQRFAAFVVLIALGIASTAFARAADEPEPADPQITGHSTVPQAGVGEANFAAVNLVMGAGVTGIRLEVFPLTAGFFKLGMEIAGGELVTSAGAAPGFDFGLRAQLRVLSGHRDALYVSPGFSAMLVLGDDSAKSTTTFFGNPTTGEACTVEFIMGPPCTTVPYAMANLDISWLHQFSEHSALELGLTGGYGVALGGSSSQGNAAGSTTPRAGFFVGMRF